MMLSLQDRTRDLKICHPGRGQGPARQGQEPWEQDASPVALTLALALGNGSDERDKASCTHLTSSPDTQL